MTQQSGQINPGSTYVVQDGDTLSSIAQQAYGNGSQPYWMALFIANQIKAQPPASNAIKAGENLYIPEITDTPQTNALYIVKQGDTFPSIAQQAYQDVSPTYATHLHVVNMSVIGTGLQPGQVIWIPGEAALPMGGHE